MHLDYSKGLIPRVDSKRTGIGTTSTSYLQKVNKDPDANIRYLAYTKLGDLRCYEKPEEKVEAVKTLISKFDHGGEPTASRAAICRTLGIIGDPQARELILRAANDPEPIIRVQACIALGHVGKDEDATILTRMMATDTLVDCRVAAIDSLGVLKPKDPRIPLVLVNGMQHDEPAIRYASLQALRKITGKDLGVEPGPWKKMLQPESVVAKPKSDTEAKPTSTTTEARGPAAPSLLPPAR
jgi:HEAT repeat protein